ncbi:hypothetical protein [Streptomyces sp. NPDC053427]|uniref:hypothetical protein n=1 Tax=Streptomyces sp. NPDC053427 TaxID=3365701 RepID=UPI0037CEA7A8
MTGVDHDRGQAIENGRVDGLRLTGEGGPLQRLIERLLESALQGEIADHRLGIHLGTECVNFPQGAGVAFGGVAFVWDAGLRPRFARPARCRAVLEAQVHDS